MSEFVVAQKSSDPKFFAVLWRHQAQEPEFEIKFEAKSQTSAERALALCVLLEHETNRTISEEDLYNLYNEPLDALADDLECFLTKYGNAKHDPAEAVDVETPGNAVFKRTYPKFGFFRSSLTLERWQRREPKGNVMLVFQNDDIVRVTRVHALFCVLQLLKRFNSFDRVLDQHGNKQHMKVVVEQVRCLLNQEAQKEDNCFSKLLPSNSASVTTENNEDLPSIPTPDRQITEGEKTTKEIKKEAEPLEQKRTPIEAGNLAQNVEVPEQQAAVQPDQHGNRPNDGAVAQDTSPRQAPTISQDERRKSRRTRRAPPSYADDIDFASPEMFHILAHFYEKLEKMNKNKRNMWLEVKTSNKEMTELCNSTGFERGQVDRLLLICTHRFYEAMFVRETCEAEVRSEMRLHFSPEFFEGMMLHLDACVELDPNDDEPWTPSTNRQVAKRGTKRRRAEISDDDDDDADAAGPSKRSSVPNKRGRPRKQPMNTISAMRPLGSLPIL